METTENREMQVTGSFLVPVGLMWKAWTKPGYIAKWWGPAGFTNTIHEMNFREGGEWKFTMHSPDGTNYPNRSIFREIIPLHKIIFEHFNPHFFATIVFEDKEEETHLIWTMLFDSEEMRDIIVNVHKADEGQKQNMERLKAYLSELKDDNQTH